MSSHQVTLSVTGPGGSSGSTAQTATGSFGQVVVVALVASTFGPYLIGQIRLEQVVVYMLLGLCLTLLAFASTFRLAKVGVSLAATWGAYVAIASVGALAPTAAPTPWPSGSTLAGLDNVALPMAVMIVIWLTARADAAPQLLTLACRLIAYLAAVNGCVAIASLRVDLTPVLSQFWDGTLGQSVAERAALLGRVSGIINQPAEAGLLYGLAGVAACYVWSHRPGRLYLALIPIVVGGVLSVSKIFLLCGLPLIMWQVWRMRSGGSRIALLFIALGTTFGLVQTGLAGSWIGMDYLTRLIDPAGDAGVNHFTAGRMGNGSTLIHIVDGVAEASPWFGMGAGGLQVPYDNGWVEAFVVAGVVGAICYTLVLVALFALARLECDRERRGLLYSVAILATVGSLGIPVLTANRVSTLTWVVIALAVLSASGVEARMCDRRLGQESQ